MVRFSHFYDFIISPEDIANGSLYRSSRFTTIYKSAIYQWKFEFDPSESSRSVRVNQGREEEEFEPQISLMLDHQRFYRRPEMKSVVYALEIRENGKTIASPPKVEMFPDGRASSLDPPGGHRMNRIIEEYMFHQPPVEREFRFSLVLDIPESSFGIGTFNSPPMLPLHPDFRYDAITNKSRHDLSIRCRNGIYKASREALFFSSSYFREMFNRTQPTEIEERRSSVAAVHTVIVHVISGTYSPPERMTPILLVEIFTLNEKYQPADFSSPLISSLEKCAFEQVTLCSEDLDALVAWLVSTAIVQALRAFHAAAALIISSHFPEFIVKYGPEMRTRSEVHGFIHRPWTPFNDTSLYDDMLTMKKTRINAFENANF